MKKMVYAARLLPTLVCAWCKCVMKPGAKKISHGICRGCATHFFGDLRPPALAPVRANCSRVAVHRAPLSA